MKGHQKNINGLQDDVSKKVKEVSKAASGTEQKLESTNKKLKNLLEKLGHDKICIDIVLVLICLGLIVVLYNVIKSKVTGKSEEAPKNSTKLF